MKKYLSLLIVMAGLLTILSCDKKREGKPRVLVFSKTAGFVHSSIPAGIAAVEKLGQENGFDVDTTKNAAYFQDDSLKKYSAVIFLNTTGNVLDYRQEAAFERYIQSGGGFVGVHAATDTEYDWRWYGKLVGGYFQSHPRTQNAKFIIKDKNSPATEFFTDTVWQRTDELYNFKNLNPDVNVLITVDESSYEGGSNGSHHPMSWYHEYDGGRAFYTELGHTEESYSEENYLKHLAGGIKYAIGDNDELDYREAKSQLPPDEDRFTKTQLSFGEFFEPTEMTILPNLDILVTQRRGEIMLYKNDTKKGEAGRLPECLLENVSAQCKCGGGSDGNCKRSQLRQKQLDIYLLQPGRQFGKPFVALYIQKRYAGPCDRESYSGRSVSEGDLLSHWRLDRFWTRWSTVSVNW